MKLNLVPAVNLITWKTLPWKIRRTTVAGGLVLLNAVVLDMGLHLDYIYGTPFPGPASFGKLKNSKHMIS